MARDVHPLAHHRHIQQGQSLLTLNEPCDAMKVTRDSSQKRATRCAVLHGFSSHLAWRR